MSYFESVLKRYIGGDEYERLRGFYRNTWFDTKFSFRVYLTQKSANLNEILYKQELKELQRTDPDKAERLKVTRASTFLSQYGILMKADDMAAAYNDGAGSFPSVLIVDEAGRTGEDIAELYYALETAVLTAWKKKRTAAFDWDDVLRVRDRLREAVEFRIFLINENGLLMESDLASRVDGIEASEEEIYQFTQDISRAITLTPRVENSAFVPTFYVSYKDYMAIEESLKNGSVWHSERWRYHDTTNIIWDKQVCLGEQVKLNYTVRATFIPAEGNYALTSYPFWGALDQEGYKSLALLIRQKLQENGNFPRFCSILNTDPVASNFVYFIASILTMATFIQGTKCKKTSFPENDLDRISQYFGIQSDIGGEILSFVASNNGMVSFRYHLRDDLELFLQNNAGMLCTMNNYADPVVQKDVALFDAENYFSMQALKSQGSKRRRRKKRIIYVGHSSFNTNLDDYIGSGGTLCDARKRIGAVLLLCQQGYIGLKRVGAALTDDKEPQFLLKAGETSESLQYQHMYRFMPALIYFDRVCKANGLNAELLVERFGDELYTKYGEEAGLGQIFREFLKDHHERGVFLEPYHMYGLMWNLSVPNRRNQVRTFKEWSRKVWSDDEWKLFDSLSQLEYINWEQKLQDRYVERVRNFFDRYNGSN